MKKLAVYLIIFSLLLLSGCGQTDPGYDIVATTLPVYDFASALCSGTGLSVGQLVTENVSCLHDYTLQVSQMRMIEGAELLILSGAGLEDFLDDAFNNTQLVIDASENIHLHSGNAHQHDGHHHDEDPHIWLSTNNAELMANNIYSGLSEAYPQFDELFSANLEVLLDRIHAVEVYGEEQLSSLSCRSLITFHDGFSYLAESFDLSILEAIEEESGSEASAAEIVHLIELVTSHQLPAIFTEVNGSDACAGIIAAETGVRVFSLDMAMSGSSYFDAMYRNIDILKEALK